eukprot:scaffold117_cov45-Prasinocladus_malaysianus.AAC.1
MIQIKEGAFITARSYSYLHTAGLYPLHNGSHRRGFDCAGASSFDAEEPANCELLKRLLLYMMS